MRISDDQLMLIEQLTYINPSVAEVCGIVDGEYRNMESFKGQKVFSYLAQFSDDRLIIMDEKNLSIGHIQTEEWAAILRTLKKDFIISNLTISDAVTISNGKTAVICLTNPSLPDEAIVAFRGTLDGNEWIDNVEGLNISDTERQKEALAYIESLPYEKITVVGHSKGGNKAQYVTVLSDKVMRCISMDGQGFSREFIEKYHDKIQKSSGAIKNLSLNNDYVHILLFPVPGSEQIYYIGSGLKSGVENHSPNSFFYLAKDKEGHSVLALDENGLYLNPTDSEHPSIAYLHGYVNFVLNVMPAEDKMAVVSYIGLVLKIVMGGGSVEINGIEYSKSNILAFVLSDPEIASLLVAYLVAYIHTYKLTETEIFDLLEAFNLGGISKEITTSIQENVIYSVLISGSKGLFDLLINRIADEKKNHLIPGLLVWLSSLLKIKYGIEADCAGLWKMIDNNYQKIGEVDIKTANKNVPLSR